MVTLISFNSALTLASRAAYVGGTAPTTTPASQRGSEERSVLCGERRPGPERRVERGHCGRFAP
eukprot:654388-Heterocapsa_arctica.AAC.1